MWHGFRDTSWNVDMTNEIQAVTCMTHYHIAGIPQLCARTLVRDRLRGADPSARSINEFMRLVCHVTLQLLTFRFVTKTVPQCPDPPFRVLVMQYIQHCG